MADLGTMQAVMKVWKNAQAPMEEVTRWGNFPDYGQSLLAHANSVGIVGDLVAVHMPQSFNHVLFQTALRLHDHGEPLTGGDEHDGNKTVGKEYREWQAFERLTEDMPMLLRGWYQMSFLLQFVRKPLLHHQFEGQAGDWLKQLNREASLEAAAFEFTERLDYLFSAFEGHGRGVRNDEETMLAHTLERQVSRLDAIVEEFPVFDQIWTPQLRDELSALES